MLEWLDFLIAFATIITGVSLLISLWVQAISWLLALRGRDLQKGLIKTFNSVVPIEKREGLRADFEELTKKILAEGPLSHAVFSEKFARVRKWIPYAQDQVLATAIRPAEVVARLEQLYRQGEEVAARLEKEGEKIVGEVDETAVRIGEAAKIVLAAFPDDVKEGNRVHLLLESAKKQLHEHNISIESPAGDLLEYLEAELVGKMSQTRKSLESWIDSALDRVQQKFASEARFWTIVGAFLAAWILQLDVFSIWDQLARNSEARDQLVAASNVVIERTANTLTDYDPLSPEFHRVILEQMEADESLGEKYENQLRTMRADVAIPRFSRESGRTQYLRDFVGTDDNGFVDAFEKKRSQLAKEKFQKLLGEYDANTALLEEAGFSLRPPKNPREKCGGIIAWRLGFCDDFGNPNPVRFFGMGITAALLTLGTPFWFNLLKTMANLRPMLAKKVQEEKVA